MKMNFSNEEILKIIESYSKASGQKFVIESGRKERMKQTDFRAKRKMGPGERESKEE